MRSRKPRLEQGRCRPPFGNGRLLVPLLAIPMLAMSMAAGAAPPPSLPGGATPGGVQPGLPVTPPLPVPEQAFPVPPMVERPLNVDDGPTLAVSAFELEGVVDHPQQGVSVREIEELVEAERKKRPAGFTVGRMQEVANQVTDYYRSKGFILAQGYIPAQEVRGARVVIRVLEGKLGKVDVEDNSLFSKEVVSAPFKTLIGQSVTKGALESAVLRLSDTPGLSAFTVLKPGAEVGEADASVKVRKEQRYDFAARIDNHGSDFTGDTRLLLDGAVNNIGGVGDALSATLVDTSRPSNSLYGDLRYQRPTHRAGGYWGLSVAKNRFEVGESLASLGLEGDTRIGELFVRDAFIRSRERNLYGGLSFALKRADLTQQGSSFTDDRLSVLNVETAYDSIDSRFHGINQAYLRVAHGFPDMFGALSREADGSVVPPSRRGGSLQYAGGNFDKVQAGYTRWQNVAANNSLLLRLQGQYSNDLLTSLEQFAMGGPDSVRAYPVSEFLMDKGYFMSLEYVANAPGFAEKPAFGDHTWGEVLQFSVFFDTATGWLKDPLPSETERVSLGGVGVGVQLTLPKGFDLNLTYAEPTTRHDASDGHDSQLFFNLRYKL